MNDRERILRRIRQGLGTGPNLPATRDSEENAESTDSFEAHGIPVCSQDLVQEFQREARLQSVEVHEASDLSAAAHVLARILETMAAARVLAWSHPLLDAPDMARVLQDHRVSDPSPGPEGAASSEDRSSRTARAARADVGVTAVDWALADTGTLVLRSGPGRSRSASLLPPVHVALLPVSRILPDLSALLEHLPLDPDQALKQESSLTLITGTSKTADIELTLVRGVHGPGRVHVILVADEGV